MIMWTQSKSSYQQGSLWLLVCLHHSQIQYDLVTRDIIHITIRYTVHHVVVFFFAGGWGVFGLLLNQSLIVLEFISDNY